MRIAFYAPLKPPDHPVPSGDRQLARLLMRALALGGHDVALASRFRSFDRDGDAARQARIGDVGTRIADRLARRSRPRPDLWFTYHLHHKAPDVVGPAVCRALAIPYVVAEASVAPKQRDGRWSTGYAQSLDALRAANGIVFVNPADVPEVRRVLAPTTRTLALAPFVDVEAFREARSPPRRASDGVRLVAVAMMRERAKLASYRLLANALRRIESLPWTLAIVGDGEARTDVAHAFARFGQRRVRFLGALDATGVAAALRDSEAFVWPAIDEAFGMALLEAQACGVPVVAGRSEGVAAIVADGRSGLIAPARDAAAFAAAVKRIVEDASLRASLAHGAIDYVRETHDLAPAARSLDRFLAEVAAARPRESTA